MILDIQKKWRRAAEETLLKLKPDQSFGGRVTQLREIASELGFRPESLRKYIAVHQFVMRLAEHQPDRAFYLWSLDSGAAEAFKRWAERDLISALAAMKTAEAEQKSTRLIISEERANRVGVSSSPLDPNNQLSLESLVAVNQEANALARKSETFNPRIPVLFDIDTNLMTRPAPQSSLDWCGVDWIATGTAFSSEQNTKDTQADFNGKRSVWGSLLNSTEFLDLAIINVPESLKNETYANEAGEVIAKALLASRLVFLVLVNVPSQHAWDIYVKSAPDFELEQTNGTSLRDQVLEQHSTSLRPFTDINLIKSAWVEGNGLAGNVVICYPDIWDQVMFVDAWLEVPSI